MNVKLRVLTAGVLFFTGQLVMAQKDSLKVEDIDEVIVVGFGQKKTVQEMPAQLVQCLQNQSRMYQLHR